MMCDIFHQAVKKNKIAIARAKSRILNIYKCSDIILCTYTLLSVVNSPSVRDSMAIHRLGKLAWQLQNIVCMHACMMIICTAAMQTYKKTKNSFFALPANMECIICKI